MRFFCRALIYPFLIRGGKPTPFVSFALAFVFCIYNGYMQIRYLSHYAVYPAHWLTHPCFIIGKRLLHTWTINSTLFLLCLCCSLLKPNSTCNVNTTSFLPFNSLHSCVNDYFMAGGHIKGCMADGWCNLYLRSLKFLAFSNHVKWKHSWIYSPDVILRNLSFLAEVALLLNTS